MTYRYRQNTNIRNAVAPRAVSSRVRSWFVIVAIAGLILAAGFIISARKHFEAVEVGYQSEELRRKANELSDRLRQLQLEYARASSPIELEKRAKRMGLERRLHQPADSESQPKPR